MEKLYSRKLWVAIISAIIIGLNQKLNLHLSQDSILSLAGVVMAYLFGQSYVDSKQPPTPAEPAPTPTEPAPGE